MTHPNEEQLIAYRYGDVSETHERAAIERHLVTCDGCRTSYEALQRVLAAVEAAPVPERDASYGSRVWQRIGPQLDQRERFDWRAWLVPRRWVAVGAMAALVFAAFLAGRFWPRPTQQESAGPIPVQVRERILLVAVGDHLDHAQMVLAELVNAGATETLTKGGVDISFEQQRAQDLVEANRLYRQTAARTGDSTLANVLDELERVLVEIAHSPAQLSSAQLNEIQRRIEARGILFKVRVIGSDVRQRGKSAGQIAPRGSS